MRIVVALGGNALLRRGEKLSAAAQQKTIGAAARVLADAILAGHHLIITHGNGPQVGLLALQSAAGPAESALPLDVLDAESEGWIGYAIELALRNALPEGAVLVTIVTQILVDPKDQAFAHPTKPIGPIYDRATAEALAKTQNWSIAPDGATNWRRVVASPKPLGIVEIDPIMRLVNTGVTVICGGGGGVPVCAASGGGLRGVEAVIDKDATSALLAEQAGADMLIMLTDVPGVYRHYGAKDQHIIARAGPKELSACLAASGAGSMGPKITAACDFVRKTGQRAAIGALGDLMEIIAGWRGTTVAPEAGPCSRQEPWDAGGGDS